MAYVARLGGRQGGAPAWRGAPARRAPRPVLAADTAVVIGGEILGKPARQRGRGAHAAVAVGTHSRGADRRRAGRPRRAIPREPQRSHLSRHQRAPRRAPIGIPASRGTKPADTRFRDSARCSSHDCAAAIPASWACRCSRPRSCCRRRACRGGCPGGRRRDEHRNPHQRQHRTRRAPRWSRTACCRRCYLERASRRGLISNIYKGRVSRVLPGMQAAFIEIGLERTAFLHASDIFDPHHADTGIEPPRTENIRALVAEGNEILVQVVKDPLGHQGRAAHDLHYAAVALSRLHAAGPRRRRVGAHRGRGANASACAARSWAGIETGRERRIHRAHRRRGRAGRGAARRHACICASSGSSCARRGCAPAPGNLVHADLPLHLRILRDLLRPDVDRVLIDQPSAHREMQEFAATFMPECAAAHRAVRRGAADIRAAPRRGGDPEGAGPQGAAEIGRLFDHRPDRGDDHDRRQHRRLRRPPQSRGNDLSHQSRGGGDHRAAAAPAQPRRHHHHRFHRHGGAGSPPPGHPGAGEGARATITSRPASPRCRRSGWWR